MQKAEVGDQTHAATTYSSQKAKMNAMIQEASRTAITSFIQKAKTAQIWKISAKKRNINMNMNNFSLTVSVISIMLAWKTLLHIGI